MCKLLFLGTVLIIFINVKVYASESFMHNMEWNFYVYDAPSLMSQKADKFNAQNILIQESDDNGFAMIDTYLGEKWAYLPQNKFFYEHYFYIFDEMDLSADFELLSPQIITVIEEYDDGWAAIETYKGVRWIYYPYEYTNLNVDAPVFYQMKTHINGCESYAAATALNALGVEITPNEFIEYVPQNVTKYTKQNGVTVWGDPDEEFVGSMSGSGYAAYPPVIVNTVNENFSDSVFAEDITGASYDEIVSYLRKGGIVLIWYHPSGLTVRVPSTWYTPEGKRIDADYGTHTVAITGFNTNKGTVYVNDSLDGRKKELSWKSVASTYDTTGQKSVYINKSAYLTKAIEDN